MSKTLARLSSVEVEHLAGRKDEKTRHYHDGGGLYLCVDKRGSASWMFRYMIDGKARTMGLGAFPSIGLAKARRVASAAREAKAEGKDPLEERDAARAARRLTRAAVITFQAAADAYVASKRDEWKNAKHAEQWSSTLKSYAFPLIGTLAVSEVDNGAILRVLQQGVSIGSVKERLWTARPETASRLRGRLEAVLGWAAAGGLRSGDNPARWGILKHQLPAKSKLPRGRVKHQAALPIDQIPAFMHRLRGMEGQGARALEFAILTAARSGEVRGASWDEFDLRAKLWTVPGERMKAGKAHRVPLSPRVMELLESISVRPGGGLVFSAPRGGMLSDMTLSAVTRRMKVPAVPHGFRSSFRDWGSERTSYPGEMLEMALAHTVSDKVEAAYRRSDLFEKRRKLMAAWAIFCASPPREVDGKVTPIRAALGQADSR